jgi:hypothetical protein
MIRSHAAMASSRFVYSTLVGMWSVETGTTGQTGGNWVRSMRLCWRLFIDFLVPRDGIEPPTRGFSVPAIRRFHRKNGHFCRVVVGMWSVRNWLPARVLSSRWGGAGHTCGLPEGRWLRVGLWSLPNWF